MAGIEVLIPVLVDSKGRWVSNGAGRGHSPSWPEKCPQPDWGLMYDCLTEMDDEPQADGTRKIWIKAFLTLPENDQLVTYGQTIPHTTEEPDR